MSANSEHHDDVTPNGADGRAGPPAAATGTGPARRRLLQAGLGAAPVILTLTSKPAFAQTVTDRSAMESMSTCASGASEACLEGQTVEQWRGRFLPSTETLSTDTTTTDTTLATFSTTETTDTTTTDDSDTTSTGDLTFKWLFGDRWVDVNGRKWQGNPTIGDVLHMDPSLSEGTASDDADHLGKRLVAAYLNAVSLDYPMTPEAVRALGAVAVTGSGTFAPFEGTLIEWGPRECRGYVTNTIALY
ncbi:hypothetical protein [Caenispirillum salinarum]|uniref:hypothetical protein n=1 Tax=Caenispirillum salinarum TaxID=859058 RepID=UPI00384DF6CF